MVVSHEYKCLAKCHPSDVWQVFQEIERWKQWSAVFGNAGWVHGDPWHDGSRFFVELLQPKRLDLEVIVQNCEAPHRLTLLAHGAGVAAEQSVTFDEEEDGVTTLYVQQTFFGSGADHELPRMGFFDLYQQWFEELALQGEKHCLEIAL